MNSFYKNISLWLVIILMIVMLYNIFNQQQLSENNVGYSEFLSMVENNYVQDVLIQDNELIVTDRNGSHFKVYAPNDVDLIKSCGKKVWPLPPSRLRNPLGLLPCS